MKNTTSMPMLHLGIKEETPLKKNYLAPNITMVEFAAEIGLGGSIQELSSFGGSRETDWAAAENLGDGTETYNNRSGDFF